MKRLFATLFAGVAALACPLAHAHEIYGQFGTEGVGIGYGHSLGPLDNIRAEFNGFSLSRGFNTGDLHYDGKLNLAHAGLYLDFSRHRRSCRFA